MQEVRGLNQRTLKLLNRITQVARVCQHQRCLQGQSGRAGAMSAGWRSGQVCRRCDCTRRWGHGGAKERQQGKGSCQSRRAGCVLQLFELQAASRPPQQTLRAMPPCSMSAEST